MELNINIDGKIGVLEIKGNLLGENDAKPISEIVEKCIGDNIVHFIFDLEEMQYLNSTGLSILINTMTKARKNNGEMCLVNSPKQLIQLLEITKLSAIIPQCGTVESAKNKLNTNNN
ncbi:MAG: STAS domain-containing protein [Chitinophagales bacterium]